MTDSTTILDADEFASLAEVGKGKAQNTVKTPDGVGDARILTKPFRR